MINFVEFRQAIQEIFVEEEEMPSEEEIKRAYDTVDRDLSDDVTWSEW